MDPHNTATGQPPMTPAAALKRLSDFQGYTPLRAVARLSRRLESLHLLTLYRRYFPRQYARSRASTQPARGCGHSAMEIEFAHRLARRFPFNADWMEDCEERLDFIPVYTGALEVEAADDWRPPWRAIYQLIQGEFNGADNVAGWEEFEQRLPSGSELPVEYTRPLNQGYRLDVKKLWRKLRQAFPDHFQGLQVMFAMADYGTGNPFLDTTDEMLGNSQLPEWSEKEIDWLTRQWAAADKLLKQAERACRRLEAHTYRGLADLIRVWNACSSPNPPDNQPDQGVAT